MHCILSNAYIYVVLGPFSVRKGIFEDNRAAVLPES